MFNLGCLKQLTHMSEMSQIIHFLRVFIVGCVEPQIVQYLRIGSV